LELLPEASQVIDSDLLAFSLSKGYKGTIFTLIPAKTHVTLGFFHGVDLTDPNHLLIGTGKVHRHVKIRSLDQLNSQEFIQLVKTAVDVARLRLVP
jgi:hypothetical protein